MLRKETVTAATLELLKELMHDDHLIDFFLVGGTALSLQIGHRISVDIDLFSQNSFDENAMHNYLTTNKDFQLSYKDKNTLKGEINGVQVDLITHAYPLVNELKREDGIRLASIDDIAAMKLNAIVGNGTRAKDFLDIAYLSCFLSLEQMMQACEIKYKNINPFVVIRSLVHTGDVVRNVPIQLINESYSFEPIEYRLNQMPDHSEIVFERTPFYLTEKEKQEIKKAQAPKKNRGQKPRL